MLWKLVELETYKLIRKKRFFVVVAMLFLLVLGIAYGAFRQQQSLMSQYQTADWKKIVSQQMAQEQSRVQSGQATGQYGRINQVRLQLEQYYLTHNINPLAPGAAMFMKTVIDSGMSTFLPLIVVVLAADIVSGEISEGTIKLLIPRPVRRGMLLFGKFAAVVIGAAVVMVLTAVFSWLVGGVFFGFHGFGMPTLTGFQYIGTDLISTDVHIISLMKYLVMAYSLGVCASAAVAAVTCSLSTFVRSAATGTGVMMVVIMSGKVIAVLASSWTTLKYFFPLNLGLSDYLSGNPPAIPGMTLTFSVTVLFAWMIGCFGLAYFRFVTRDFLD